MKSLSLTLIILLGQSLAGCTAVAPWERGTLAKGQMAMDPHPLQTTMRTHNYNSREAAVGGHSSGGGGCGCY
jgi:hypothetical protein